MKICKIFVVNFLLNRSLVVCTCHSGLVFFALCCFIVCIFQKQKAYPWHKLNPVCRLNVGSGKPHDTRVAHYVDCRCSMYSRLRRPSVPPTTLSVVSGHTFFQTTCRASSAFFSHGCGYSSSTCILDSSIPLQLTVAGLPPQPHIEIYFDTSISTRMIVPSFTTH